MQNNLGLRRGEVLIIVGAQGSGKTTMAYKLLENSSPVLNCEPNGRITNRLPYHSFPQYMEYDAIVIDGMPCDSLLAECKYVISECGDKAPYIIICCQDSNFNLRHILQLRRLAINCMNGDNHV